jgi:hypothetical protein
VRGVRFEVVFAYVPHGRAVTLGGRSIRHSQISA